MSRRPRGALLSAKEVAGLLGVCERTIQRMCLRGDLRASRIGNRWRIAPRVVDAFFEAEARARR